LEQDLLPLHTQNKPNQTFKGLTGGGLRGVKIYTASKIGTDWRGEAGGVISFFSEDTIGQENGVLI